MLKIRIIAIGKDKDRWIREGCAHFEKLLSRFASVEWVILPPEKSSSSLPPAEVRKLESPRLLREFKKGFLIALADAGRKMDSRGLARELETWQTRCGGVVNFLIGGAYGLDEAVLKQVDFVLSLSSMTFSHQLVRLILLEQLYRAFSILHGTSYHK